MNNKFASYNKYIREVLEHKLKLAENPGVIVELTPAEADFMETFEENALTMDDAVESSLDLLVANNISDLI